MLLPVVLAVSLYQTADIPIVTGVGVSGVTQGGRAPAPIDTVQALIVEGKWKTPAAGDKVAGARGAERTWTEVKANKDGVFEGGAASGGYIDAVVDSDSDKPMLLSATGDTMVYINGVPRAGDPYSYGYLKIPFLLKKGRNEFLFTCGRGSLKARLVQPDLVIESPQLNGDDMTLPDILVGRDEDLVASIPIVNCSSKPLTGLTMRASLGNGFNRREPLPAIGPWSVRKVPFTFRSGKIDEPGEIGLTLDIGPDARGGFGYPKAVVTKLRIRKPTEHYKRTFVSQIDGSVQYYGVCPSLRPSKDNALIMTVHGASVEAIGQASAYAPKDWCTIVAPTNRRPYGFDWEDWGRMDAMEVWNIAKKEFPHDPKRVILTGHSMGGHGTWTLGLTYPNEFAAIGPSAGWVSFWSYAGGWNPQDPNPVEQLLRRSMNSSDTLLMLNNAKMEDVFILHGDKDDNVPVEQARTMKAKLTDIGAKFEYHEEPGAGHWWGNQCVDWPPMFAMFDKARYESPSKFSFTTVNPGVSATDNGFTILQQVNPLEPSSIECERDGQEWRMQTKNVASFVISEEVYSSPHFTVNGQNFSSDMHGPQHPEWMRTLTLAHGSLGQPAGYWFTRPMTGKSPKVSGPFKLAFQNRMVFVVGTHGTAAENAWSANKARFDAESWYYRGNGAADIIRDDEVGKFRDRNLVLFGNADTNSAFKLISNSPVQVKRGRLTVGDHKWTGDDKAAVFLFPEGRRMIAVVGGTSLAGMRYTDRMPYFTSGVAYPDWTVLDPSVLTKGSKAVTAAGFFDNQWKFDAKQSAFTK